MNFDRKMPIAFKNMPLFLKVIIAIVPVLTAAIYVFYTTSNNIENKKRFYNEDFSSTVVKSNISEGRTTEFHLKNGLKIYFWLSAKNTLIIGDSIEKNSNSYIYSVYRKDFVGQYKFYKNYDFTEMK